MIDLRSDTVTKPTPGMREAMMASPVGDDVYGEDETVNRLEAQVAKYFGFDAAIFVPSGTMANQIAVRLHCRPGEEMLVEPTSHVILWEGGGAAALNGVSAQTISGTHGLLNLGSLVENIRPDDIHSTQTKLLWLENTHNRGGGRIQSYNSCREMAFWARDRALASHLDGARIWNAIVATGIPGTMSVCFSKGLGAPVGSALLVAKKHIGLARRYRKLFGGAMRQVGFLAGACLYAMEHHVNRLAEDHANAQILANAVRETKHLKLDPEKVETNVVWFRVLPPHGLAMQMAKRFKQAGILVSALGEQMIRMCTHLDVSREECEQVAAFIRTI
jgi:threonine aldolase